MKSKADILAHISTLLDKKDCVVRIQREMTPAQINERVTDAYVLGKKVTIIIAATDK